jgi:hypothetical protein
MLVAQSQSTGHWTFAGCLAAAVLLWSNASVAAIGTYSSGLTQDSEEAAHTEQAKATPEQALRECVVLLAGGREVAGLMVRHDENEVVIRVEGIETLFAANQVRSIRILEPLLERYETMRSLIKESDLDGRVLLAEWLRAREQYELALREVNIVLARDAFHEQAREMRAWLEMQIELVGKQQVLDAEADASGSEESGAERFAQRVEARRAFPLLKAEDINLIKVYEVDLQRPPRMVVRRETVERLIRLYPGSHLIPSTAEGRDALFRKRPEELLELMFRLQARELYGEVMVRDHPPALAKFRAEVHSRWLLNACATAQCHGGSEAGRLHLFDGKVNSDATLYTNFLILDRFKLDDGTPLINYAEPARSPLLHMGLPREESLYPHPDAPRTRGSRGWSPVFKSSQDKGFADAVAWISGMYRPRPEYPIEYKVAEPVPEGDEGGDADPKPVR